jgi:glycerol-3-phosphate acyltransferase PlsY
VTLSWQAVALYLLASLLGGIPVGWLLVRRRLAGIDIRRYGSGNIGTSNIYRNAGMSTAIIVGPLQFAQGLFPVALARLLGLPLEVAVIVAICAVAGNGWPIYLRFRGGRGIAVATGAVAALSLVGLAVLLTCYAVGALTRRIAVAVLIGFLVLPAVGLVFDGRAVAVGFSALLALVVLRRLEGLRDDARTYGDLPGLVMQRLALDRRPGRPLTGPRTDPGAEPGSR